MNANIFPAALVILLFAAALAQASPVGAQDARISAYSIYAAPCDGSRPHLVVEITNNDCQAMSLVGWSVGMIDRQCPIQNMPVALTGISQTAYPCEAVLIDLQWGGRQFNKVFLTDNFGNRKQMDVPAGIDWTKNTRVSKDCRGQWVIEPIHCHVQTCAPCRIISDRRG